MRPRHNRPQPATNSENPELNQKIAQLTQEAEERANKKGPLQPYTVERFRETMFSKLRRVGAPEFDRHHEQLVSYIVDVYEVVQVLQRKRPSDDVLEQLSISLDKLQEYTVYHFREEERFLEEINYPQLEPHKELHKAFVSRFIQIRRDIHDGKPHYVLDLFFSTFSWLFEHINTHDMQYGRYFKESCGSRRPKRSPSTMSSPKTSHPSPRSTHAPPD
ncbi:MAG: hemerythrin family protein [Magnetococcales bacterium]|nr:hemerythrin family protein [Magnetococcales bacterium]